MFTSRGKKNCFKFEEIHFMLKDSMYYYYLDADIALGFDKYCNRSMQSLIMLKYKEA